jgi:hypothetical protein
MKRIFLPVIIALLATLSTSGTAIAQSRAESRPDDCGYERYGEFTCNFLGAENGNTVMSVFRDSIKRLDSRGTVNFDYITSSRRVRNRAWVSCHESLDHWHRRSGRYSASQNVPVSSYTTHRMLNYICEQARHPVGDQVER